MQCPKCSNYMTKEAGGFARLNAESSNGFPIADNYRCPICGKYIEVFAEKEKIEVSMKNNRNYPNTRRSLGDSGWLKGMVVSEFSAISRWRLQGETWVQIRKRLTRKYPAIAETGHDSVANVWRRLFKEREDDASNQ